MDTMRFYPENVDSFAQEPRRNQFSFIDSPTFGRGVISQSSFQSGALVCRFTGDVLDTQNLYTLQIKPGLYLHDPHFMGYILHHCDPNLQCDMSTFTFTALKTIKPHDLLTMDYETTEDSLFRSFHCQCGAEHCRGLILGRLHR